MVCTNFQCNCFASRWICKKFEIVGFSKQQSFDWIWRRRKFISALYPSLNLWIILSNTNSILEFRIKPFSFPAFGYYVGERTEVLSGLVGAGMSTSSTAVGWWGIAGSVLIVLPCHQAHLTHHTHILPASWEIQDTQNVKTFRIVFKLLYCIFQSMTDLKK